MRPFDPSKRMLRMRSPLGIAIAYYKACLNPLMPDRCIYRPSCSAYARQAYAKYGALRATAMSACRIMRCAPWGKGGFDPVKENWKGKAKWVL